MSRQERKSRRTCEPWKHTGAKLATTRPRAKACRRFERTPGSPAGTALMSIGKSGRTHGDIPLSLSSPRCARNCFARNSGQAGPIEHFEPHAGCAPITNVTADCDASDWCASCSCARASLIPLPSGPVTKEYRTLPVRTSARSLGHNALFMFLRELASGYQFAKRWKSVERGKLHEQPERQS